MGKPGINPELNMIQTVKIMILITKKPMLPKNFVKESANLVVKDRFLSAFASKLLMIWRVFLVCAIN